MISRNVDITQDSLSFRAITHLDNGIQLLSLAWSENILLVDGVYHQGRQIYRVDLENGVLDPTTSGRWENRDQIITSDGLIYTTDNSGINNLVIEKNGIQDYITNVMGGAFMPSVSSDGKILYSLYENGRYNICLLYTSPSPRDRTRSRMPSSA